MNKIFKVSIVLIVAVLGTLSILFISLYVNQKSSGDISTYFKYQLLTLPIALASILILFAIFRNKLRFLKIGKLNAPTERMMLLGVKKGENWKTIGLTFVAVISTVTLVYLITTYSGQLQHVSPIIVLWAVLFALPLAALNAFTEEIITRWTVAESLKDTLAKYAPWVSAIIFGSVHYFGIPGGLTGSLLAGFLAWFSVKSIQQTGGMGWALIIHFVQDILIFTITISLFL